MGTLSISAKPEMPTLSPLAVQIQGINPDPTPNTFFDWSVGITFDETSCTCGKKGVTFSDGFVAPNVLGGTFSFPWPWIRGGDLTIAARATVRGLLLEAIFTGTITETDPATNDIRTELGDITMRRIANVESGFHQFEADPGTGRIVPKFNFKLDAQRRKGRGDGGAGICQITPPSAAEIWDWKANVKKGKQIFAGARGAALTYLNQHIQNGQFPNDLGLVNADVVLREAIQNFNGGHFWQWNAAANRWEARPPNNYVDLVLSASP
jgi:hypothetical protein